MDFQIFSKVSQSFLHIPRIFQKCFKDPAESPRIFKRLRRMFWKISQRLSQTSFGNVPMIFKSHQNLSEIHWEYMQNLLTIFERYSKAFQRCPTQIFPGFPKDLQRFSKDLFRFPKDLQQCFKVSQKSKALKGPLTICWKLSKSLGKRRRKDLFGK